MNASVRIGLLVSVPEISMLDEPCPGRPIVEKVNEILRKIEVDRQISSRNIATELNIHYKTVLNHLHKTGYQKKLGT